MALASLVVWTLDSLSSENGGLLISVAAQWKLAGDFTVLDLAVSYRCVGPTSAVVVKPTDGFLTVLARK